MTLFGDGALRTFRRLMARITHRTTEVDDLYERGSALIDAGRYDEAVDVLSKALALSPDDVEALERRATASMMLGDDVSAIADLERAVSIEPQSHAVRASLCSVYDSSDPERAIEHCDIALRLEPDDAPSLNNRSVALSWLGHEAEAIADLDRALALAPDEPFFLCNRAIARIEHGDLDGAEADIERASAHWPTDADLLLALGRIALLRDRNDEARDLVMSVVDRKPGLGEGSVMLGMIAWRDGRGGDALACFDEALRGLSRHGTPDLSRRVRWMALQGRGIARCHLGAGPDGAEDIAAAQALRPGAGAVFTRWGLHGAPGRAGAAPCASS